MKNSNTVNQEYFDDVTKDENFYFWVQQEKIEKLKLILDNITPKDIIADIGCFTGLASSRYYQKSNASAQIYGFDISTAALSVAESRGLHTAIWNIEQEPCPGKSNFFDVVIAADVIEHIFDTDSFIKELIRITKNNGNLIITTPNLASWLNRVRIMRGKMPWMSAGVSPTFKLDNAVDLTHLRLGTVAEWKAFFNHQGLLTKSVFGYTILHARKGNIKDALIKTFDRYFPMPVDWSIGLVFHLIKQI